VDAPCVEGAEAVIAQEPQPLYTSYGGQSRGRCTVTFTEAATPSANGKLAEARRRAENAAARAIRLHCAH
jgi:hypothetical protein